MLQGYDVVVCAKCGFCFGDHIPAQSDFDEHYREMSKYESQGQGGKETELDLVRFKAMADSIIPALPDRDACLLDIGCATGCLLGLFKERGYAHVLGYDPSLVCAQTAKELYDVRVITGTFHEIKQTLAQEPLFACVTLTGVLEHIQDIGPSLRDIRQLLVGRGLLFIEVPDAASFVQWLGPPFQEFSTEHINFFSSTSLDNLMRRFGFVRVFSHQITRELINDTRMPVVTALYRKDEERQPFVPARDTETERGLLDYIRRSEETENEITRTLEGLVRSAKPIIVWGVGTHTMHLLTTSQLSQANITAFVDSNSHYQGKRLNGILILAPSQLRDRTESILISSGVYQAVIEKQIREDLRLTNELIKLYPR